MIRKVYPSTQPFDRVIKWVKYEINGDNLAVATSATLPAFVNNEANTVIIVDAILHVTTVSNGACTIDIGVTSTSANTTDDDIFDGINVASGGTTFAIMRDAALDSGANVNVRTCAVGAWVTVNEKTGDAEGLRANLYIGYFEV